MAGIVLVYGFINSMVLALLAIGFALTFSISGIANFAHGALYLLAGFSTWIFLNGLGFPYALAILLAVIITALIGAAIHEAILRRIRGLHSSEIIATFSLGVAILETFRYFGFVGSKYVLPVFMKGSLSIGGIPVDYQRLIILGAGAGLVVLLWLFTRYTKTGLAFRAIAQSERTALTLGIDSDKVATLSLAFGGALVALAAVLLLPLGQITVEIGLGVLLNALAICILGGLGSVSGIFLASLIIGYAQILTVAYLAPHWSLVVTLAAIFLVLIVKPSGIMGKQKELEERV